MEMIIAVDFDGTIVTDAFPEVGELQPHAKEVLSELREAGHKLILWTCRENHYFEEDKKYLDYAIDFLEEEGIIFDTVNETIYNKDWKHFHNRKPFAHVYIDDRNLNGFPGWLKVKEILLEEKMSQSEMDYHEFIEKFASVWRKLGSPNTKDLIVIIEEGSKYWNMTDETILGIPVYVVNQGVLNGIAIASLLDAELVENFEELWCETKN